MLYFWKAGSSRVSNMTFLPVKQSTFLWATRPDRELKSKLHIFVTEPTEGVCVNLKVTNNNNDDDLEFWELICWISNQNMYKVFWIFRIPYLGKLGLPHFLPGHLGPLFGDVQLGPRRLGPGTQLSGVQFAWNLWREVCRWWPLRCSASTERAGSQWRPSTLQPKQTRGVDRCRLSSIENSISDGCSTECYKWDRLDGMEITMWGYT